MRKQSKQTRGNSSVVGFLPNSDPATTPGPSAEAFIDQSEMLKRLPICAGTLKNWRKRELIPYAKLGARIVYHWPTVEAALLRRQRGAS